MQMTSSHVYNDLWAVYEVVYLLMYVHLHCMFLECA